MPRNGSGTYTLPAGNPVVTGTVISSTVHNNTMTDVADELTNSVDKDGQTVITGTLDFNGNPIVLDADADSKIEVSTDDRFDLTLGAVLSLSLTSTEALKLDAIAALAVTDGNFIVGNGTTFVAESGSTARASLGVDLTTKGTILAGNGTAPAVLAAGTNGHVLSYDSSEPTGIKGIAIPDTARDYQAFTSSGTWTKPDDAEFVLVEIWSGGGGGPNTTASNSTLGGGSGGEYISRIFQASALGATETVTIGAGGAGGATAGDNAGATGGNTTFGSLLTAIGGNPGTTNANQIATIPRSYTASGTQNDALGLAYLVTPQAGHGGVAARPTGGNTIYGGAGGGASGSGAGGVSAYGGNGGAGNNTLNTAAGNGTAPAGGGGASGNNGGGGAGGRGECRVWTW